MHNGVLLLTQGREMYDQIYKRIDDNLWKDAGCGSELDYVEQSSWILFLNMPI